MSWLFSKKASQAKSSKPAEETPKGPAPAEAAGSQIAKTATNDSSLTADPSLPIRSHIGQEASAQDEDALDESTGGVKLTTIEVPLQKHSLPASEGSPDHSQPVLQSQAGAEIRMKVEQPKKASKVAVQASSKKVDAARTEALEQRKQRRHAKRVKARANRKLKHSINQVQAAA